MRAVLAALFLCLSLTGPSHAGIASFYGGGKGEKLNSHMANGQRFNPSAMVAAHRTLPFGTKVRVVNLANGKSVVVVIADRGPAAWTRREIDLSRGAFARIASLSSGLVRVRVERL